MIIILSFILSLSATAQDNYFFMHVKKYHSLMVHGNKELERIKIQSPEIPKGERRVRADQKFYDSIIQKLKEISQKEDQKMSACLFAEIYVEYVENSQKFTFETCNNSLSDRSSNTRSLLSSILSL